MHETNAAGKPKQYCRPIILLLFIISAVFLNCKNKNADTHKQSETKAASVQYATSADESSGGNFISGKPDTMRFPGLNGSGERLKFRTGDTSIVFINGAECFFFDSVCTVNTFEYIENPYGYPLVWTGYTVRMYCFYWDRVMDLLEITLPDGRIWYVNPDMVSKKAVVRLRFENADKASVKNETSTRLENIENAEWFPMPVFKKLGDTADVFHHPVSAYDTISVAYLSTDPAEINAGIYLRRLCQKSGYTVSTFRTFLSDNKYRNTEFYRTRKRYFEATLDKDLQNSLNNGVALLSNSANYKTSSSFHNLWDGGIIYEIFGVISFSPFLSLYNNVLDGMESISGGKFLQKGSLIGLQSFAFLNGKYIDSISATVLPKLASMKVPERIQWLYDNSVRSKIVTWANVYMALAKHPDRARIIRGYYKDVCVEGKVTFSDYDYMGLYDVCTANYSMSSDEFISQASFWCRRSIDGSASALWRVLSTIIIVMDKENYEPDVKNFSDENRILIPGLALTIPCYLEKPNGESAHFALNAQGMRLSFNGNPLPCVDKITHNSIGDTIQLSCDNNSFAEKWDLNLTIESKQARVLDVYCNQEVSLTLNSEESCGELVDSCSRNSEWIKAQKVQNNVWRLTDFGLVDTINERLGYSLDRIKKFHKKYENEDSDHPENLEGLSLGNIKSRARIKIRYEMNGEIRDLFLIILYNLEC